MNTLDWVSPVFAIAPTPGAPQIAWHVVGPVFNRSTNLPDECQRLNRSIADGRILGMQSWLFWIVLGLTIISVRPAGG